ncbi:MAG TPA: SGNH/GDSL hydrolase family protein [Noviherbaspirillum sp.]|nr:SGNH/GDSL hydrolase family protein [Noviherbaspirillum sp.]
MRYRNVFWDERAFDAEDGPHMPSILAIGDSWFWYPFPGGSLINYLGDLVGPKGHNIFAVGQNGAEAYQYVYGTDEKRVRRALNFHGQSLSAVFISGGGNDFAGFNDLRPLLKYNCANANDEVDCFNPQPTGELYRLMDKIAECYKVLIGRILVSANDRVKIYVHNYDYAYPSGKGVFGNSSTWLKAALDAANVPTHLQRRCIAHILDNFTLRLQQIERENQNHVVLVDSRETLQAHQWANELHPKPEGFEKIAVDRWAPHLRSAGLA